jgi:hypothetical protein
MDIGDKNKLQQINEKTIAIANMQELKGVKDNKAVKP